MVALPLPPDPIARPATAKQRTAPIPAPAASRAQLIADVATMASRVESMISAVFHAYDDVSTGRTSDLPRKSQRVTDMLVITKEEARQMLSLAYELLAAAQRDPP